MQEWRIIAFDLLDYSTCCHAAVYVAYREAGNLLLFHRIKLLPNSREDLVHKLVPIDFTELIVYGLRCLYEGTLIVEKSDLAADFFDSFQALLLLRVSLFGNLLAAVQFTASDHDIT